MKRVAGLQPYVTEYVTAINGWLREQTAVLNTWLSLADVSWMGIVAHDNRPSMDVVASLPELDGATYTAVFVQNCSQDRLFTRAGMEAAAEKIRSVYADLKRPQWYRSRFYDVPYQFNVEMQEEAFQWLEKWLTGPAR